MFCSSIQSNSPFRPFLYDNGWVFSPLFGIFYYIISLLVLKLIAGSDGMVSEKSRWDLHSPHVDSFGDAFRMGFTKAYAFNYSKSQFCRVPNKGSNVSLPTTPLSRFCRPFIFLLGRGKSALLCTLQTRRWYSTLSLAPNLKSDFSDFQKCGQ